jgi:hypothetical protein
MSGEFKSYSLSKGLHEAIVEFLVDHPEYRGPTEFLSEAARVRMEDLTRLRLEKLKAKQEAATP